MNNQPGHAEYLKLGFKAICLNGYNSHYNPDKDYKNAKKAITTGFTKQGFKGLSLQEIKDAEQKGFWIGWLVPQGIIIIDSEDPIVIAILDRLSSESNGPSIQKTNRGKQYLYRYDQKDIPGSSKHYCAGGYPVTPRIAMKNYVIMPTTNGRTWEKWTQPELLPELPPILKPHNPKNLIHLARCLSWVVGEAYREKQLAGYEDIDCAFLAILIDVGLNLEEIQYCFNLIFLDEHDAKRTEDMHTRYTEKKKSGESVIGAEQFINKIEEVGLKEVMTWVKKLDKLTKFIVAVKGPTNHGGPTYFVDENGCLVQNKYDHGRFIAIRLANFSAEIDEEITEDDGNEITHKYRLKGLCQGRPLPLVEIPAQQFAGMNWLHNYGSQVIIEPGQTVRDKVRYAIQIFSENTRYTNAYTHTGWREINGEMVFLSHGSAIGGTNVNVQLSKENARYSLPANPYDEIKALQTSLSFLDIGNRNVTLPLFTAVYIAPLTSLFSEFQPLNFSFYSFGQTGTFKTTLAVLALCHFGNFNASSLPNLEDTGNSIERRAFLLKDVLMVVDDYYPTSQKKDAQAKEALVQRIIREFSNRTGRGRLNSESKEKGRYMPRGALLITGEEIASMQSTIARIFVIEINHGDVNIGKLTQIQSLVEHLPHAMSSYINWIRSNMADIKQRLPARFAELRRKATEGAGHRKLPEQVAFLMYTLELVASWLMDKGVFTETDGKSFASEGWDTFRRLTDMHGERIKSEDPVRIFDDIILTLHRMGKVTLEQI